MNRFAVALLAGTILSAPVFAADDPAPIKGSNDTRIRTVDYSERTVTRITSTNLVPIVITYGDGELPKLLSGLKVIDVTHKDGLDPKVAAEADDAINAQFKLTDGPIWGADRHANEITLQPVRPDVGSLLLVTTDKTDPNTGTVIHHHYRYELRTRQGQVSDIVENDKVTKVADTAAYFNVVYTYSAEVKAKAEADWRVAHKDDATRIQQEKVHDKLVLAQFGGPRSYQWTHGDSDGCRALSPERVSDNGQFTTLYFPASRQISIPNKYDLTTKEESRLSWHPEKAPDSGDLMVLESVPDAFVLRRGEKQVCLFVRDPNAPKTPPPFTGTSSPEVVRETRR